MKFITFLFTVFFWFNAVAVAPYGFKGQQQSSVLYSNVLQGQNNLVTNMGGINALLETGNKNILTNPSFEHATFSTGWTNSAGTFTADTAFEIDGLKAAKLVLSSQTMSLTQSSTLYASQFADGVQGLASIRVKSSVALKVCSIQAGTVSTTNCVDVQANNKWGLYKVPFILGATSNGISINSNGTSVTGTVYIDDSFVGVVDLKADVDASRVAGEAYFAGTASCLWNRTSTTVGAFTASATCPGPTIVTSTMGQWQTTDSDLPRVTINNLPAGTYKAKFIVREFMSLATNQPVLAINDGTTTCEPISVNESNISAVSQIVECTFVYTNSGNRVFELYGASPSNTITVANIATAPRASTKFILEYFGNSSVYSSTNADTDWASCGHTTSSFTGFGTVSAIETQCKREGSDLLMKGKFTSGTPTAVEARMSLPIWNGTQLVSAGTSIIPSLQLAGDMVRNASTPTYFRNSILTEPSVSYVTIGAQFSTLNALTKQTGANISGNGDFLSFTARIPIAGWQNSNIIIGQFNGLESCADSYQCTDTFSAKVAGNAGGIVSAENIDWINGNCSVSTGVITCPLKTGLAGNGADLVNVMNCSASVMNPLAADRTVQFSNVSTSSSLVFQTVQNAILTNLDFSVICQKQGADYIGKTAKAVASDQNLRSPGVTNGIVLSASVGSSSASVCSASPCAYVDQTGGYISSVTRSSLGNYVINFNKTFEKLKCTHTQVYGAVAGFVLGSFCNNCNSIAVSGRNNSGAAQDSGWDTICTGY